MGVYLGKKYMSERFFILLLHMIWLVSCQRHANQSLDTQLVQADRNQLKKDKILAEYNDSTGRIFADFLKLIDTVTIDQTLDIPYIPWHKIAFSPSTLIARGHLDLFVRKNLEHFHNEEDSLIEFVDKTKLLKMPGHYICRFKHPHQAQISIILLALVENEHQAPGTKYYLLIYNRTTTGEPLGYDLLAGFTNESSEEPQVFQGRLSLHNENILIERMQMNGWKAQKYMVIFSQDEQTALQKVKSKAVTIPLSGLKKNIAGIHYQRHCHQNVMYCIDFPYEIFTYSASLAQEGISEDFLSYDQRSTLTVYRNHQVYEGFRGVNGSFDMKRYFDNCKKTIEESGKTITYSFFNEEYTIFSGLAPNRIIFYEKHLNQNYTIIAASLLYPVEQKTLYNKIAEQLHASFEYHPR